MSIRLRLTLLYSAILGVTLIVFAIVVYVLLRGNLTREIDNSLRTTATATARFLGGRANEPDHATDRGGVARIIALRNGSLPSPSPETYLQLIDASGSVLARSSNLSNADLTLPPPHGAVNGRRFENATLGDQEIRLFNQPVPLQPPATQAAGTGYLEVARPLTSITHTLDRLRIILALGVAGALFVAGAAGWALSTTALRPIARLTRAAHEIGQAQDFSSRVAYDGPRDEVGRLASTFNEMLGRLQAAYARIQRALEAQRRFVADASHELRTPLTTIRGNVELLELDEEDETGERREALHDIASEAERMSRLVTDLLVLARADAGLHLKRGTVELRPLMEEVYRQVRRTSGGVRIELGEMAEVSVNGSADHLKQLLLILLDNACKYSPPGGVVRLSGERSHDWLRLQVSDEGPGIPKEEQERIFDRFYRLDPSRHGEGAGLGLSIARWIVSEHDGSLTVQSRPGEGSTFTIALPVEAEATARADTRTPVIVES